MNDIRFEWDENKNQINIQKHGISFQEAVTVFYDDNAVLFDDPEHSEHEERFILLGIQRLQGCVQFVIAIVNPSL